MRNPRFRVDNPRLFLFIALLTIGVFSAHAQAPQGATPPPMPVSTFEVTASDRPIELDYPARLSGLAHAEVRAKVTGTLLRQVYTEGTQVKAGETLFVIDPAKYEAAKAAAEAAFNQADREYRRVRALFESQAVSERERDAALAAYESAEAALKNVALDLEYTRVKAPIDGFAGMKRHDVGNLISAGTVLTTVTQTKRLNARFAFARMAQLKATLLPPSGDWNDLSGVSVTIESDEGGVHPHKGHIDFVDALIDPQSGSVEARAVIDNPENTLFPGQFVRVKISGFVKKGAVLVPQSAVMQGPRGAFVYVIEAGKAAIRPIAILQESGEHFVLKSGLKAGDKIIVNNLMKIRPGAPVAPMTGQ
ncbi:MAG: efflux RND transporter periplasmic adaptor subunit [Campylobacterales bacterium]